MKEEQKGKRTRIPLRHVPLFWLGLLPVVILLWAWADSTRYITRVDYRHDRFSESRVVLFASSLQFKGTSFEAVTLDAGEWPPYELAPTGNWGDWTRRRETPYRAGLFPEPHFEDDREPTAMEWIQRFRWYVIPLWLLLLAWLPLWLALTHWQARRKARKLREAEQAVAQL